MDSCRVGLVICSGRKSVADDLLSDVAAGRKAQRLVGTAATPTEDNVQSVLGLDIIIWTRSVVLANATPQTRAAYHTKFFRLQVRYRRKLDAVDRVGYPPCLESLL